MRRFPRQFLPPVGPGKKTNRQKTLAQWRGVDTAPLERGQCLRALPTSAILPKVLKELGIDRRRSDAEILKVWNQLLDPLIVAHAQPTGLHKGTLFVTVDSSTWLSEIVRYRRKEILDRLQHSFGRDLIARVSFRVG
jgi:hypothetical protein